MVQMDIDFKQSHRIETHGNKSLFGFENTVDIKLGNLQSGIKNILELFLEEVLRRLSVSVPFWVKRLWTFVNPFFT